MALKDSSFLGKVALITGGGSGIGAETARILSSNGCSLSLVGRNEEKLQRIKNELIQNGAKDSQILLIAADLLKDENVKTVVEKTIEFFGEVHFLVNNAAVFGTNTLHTFTVEELDRHMIINVRTPLQLLQLLAKHLIKTKGSVVNISSINGIKVIPNHFTFGISKSTLNHLTLCAAQELGPKGVRVNAVAPGVTDTDAKTRLKLNEESYQKYLARSVKITALGKAGSPSDVAKMIVFLLSDDAASVTGEVIAVDGGFHVFDRKQ